MEAFFARVKQFFVRTNFELLPRATQRRDVPQPVFIMGFPRSGTTLIEQVLASHSAVRPGGELTFVGEWPQLIIACWRTAAPFPENLARTWSADHHHVATLLRDYYLARAEARGLLEPGKLLFTDKMPFNEMWLPLVRMAFPRAKIVRDRAPPARCLRIDAVARAHAWLQLRLPHRHDRASALRDVRSDGALSPRAGAPATACCGMRTSCASPERESVVCSTSSSCLSSRPVSTFTRRRRYAATPSYAQVAREDQRALGRSLSAHTASISSLSHHSSRRGSPPPTTPSSRRTERARSVSAGSYGDSIRSTTRRFSARPASVPLSAIGSLSP